MSVPASSIVTSSSGPSSRNKGPILEVLSRRIDMLRALTSLPDEKLRVVEIASGTGEHAHHFVSNIPDLRYQPTEPDPSMHSTIETWAQGHPSIILPALQLDVTKFEDDSILPPDFQHQQVDAMICINMIHISPFPATEALFLIAGRVLKPGGFLLTYGPYRVQGHMVESNVKFDENLKSRNPQWGIRDLEVVQGVAESNGLILVETVSMPANNLTLIFRKSF